MRFDGNSEAIREATLADVGEGPRKHPGLRPWGGVWANTGGGWAGWAERGGAQRGSWAGRREATAALTTRYEAQFLFLIHCRLIFLWNLMNGLLEMTFKKTTKVKSHCFITTVRESLSYQVTIKFLNVRFSFLYLFPSRLVAWRAGSCPGTPLWVVGIRG